MTETTIQVRINHVPQTLATGATLADAVACAAITPPFAAAVNLQFVPRGNYAAYVLVNNDRVELVAPITGG
jgi:sulfur carrier protein|tara:strand:+ start:191 stop:403 length:213 start_codon:yes stop_codon:yes gene_type:complete